MSEESFLGRWNIANHIRWNIEYFLSPLLLFGLRGHIKYHLMKIKLEYPLFKYIFFKVDLE